MKLTSKPAMGRHPTVRETAATVKHFRKHCDGLGITVSDGLRQLIAGYLARPFKVKPGRRGEGREAILGTPHDRVDNIEALAKHAKRMGVSTGQIIRELVRRHLG